jgi:hypothetical protein
MINIESFGIGDGGITLNDMSDNSSVPVDELSGPVSDITKSLNCKSLSSDS